MTYQQLDFIADAYIPLLLLWALTGFLTGGVNTGALRAWTSALPFILGVLFIYALMFIDNTLMLWPYLSLDYSTHTALALVFVCGIAFRGRRQRIVVSTSMVCYCLLMIYQEYHTVLDILSTGAVVLPVLLFFYYTADIRLRSG